MAMLDGLDIRVRIATMPCELVEAIPFDRDHAHAAYDPVYANRFLARARVDTSGVVAFSHRLSRQSESRAFFWGSFDLAVTRFSGRHAPRHPGGVPRLSDAVAQEAYSHEVSSAGFWPGGVARSNIQRSTRMPIQRRRGFQKSKVKPSEAFFSQQLGEFVLPYDAARYGTRSGHRIDGVSPKQL